MNLTLALIFVLIILVLVYGIPFLINFNESKELVGKSERFERDIPNPDKKILIIGDSTAVGTGVSSKERSIAGLISKDYRNASVENIAFNGAKLKDFLKFDTKNKKYDFILIQLGANDILYWSSFKEIENNLREVLIGAKKKSGKVVILHSGNVGFAPFFPKPFDSIYEKRTKKVRDIYLNLTKELGVIYVDIYSKDFENPSEAKNREIYAEDKLHLSDEGYKIWRKYIQEFSGF